MVLKKIIVANWKMHGSIAKIKADFDFYAIQGNVNKSNVIITLPFPYLHQYIAMPFNFKLGSQDVSQFKDVGAYTGEVSSLMLKDFGVEYVLVGHSERRLYLNESSAILLKKLENIIDKKLIPIFCIGEREDDRLYEGYINFLEQQLSLLKNIKGELTELIIAYEPIWSIGTGLVPTIMQIKEIAILIYSFVQKNLPHVKISILYGGSVTSSNVSEILQIPEVTGVLVGGSSLLPEEFSKICACA